MKTVDTRYNEWSLGTSQKRYDARAKSVEGREPAHITITDSVQVFTIPWEDVGAVLDLLERMVDEIHEDLYSS